jgi:hypothetical protein
MSGDTEMFDEWAEGINVRELIATKDARIAELEARIERLAGALELMKDLPSDCEWFKDQARHALSGEPTP